MTKYGRRITWLVSNSCKPFKWNVLLLIHSMTKVLDTTAIKRSASGDYSEKGEGIGGVRTLYTIFCQFHTWKWQIFHWKEGCQTSTSVFWIHRWILSVKIMPWLISSFGTLILVRSMGILKVRIQKIHQQFMLRIQRTWSRTCSKKLCFMNITDRTYR